MNFKKIETSLIIIPTLNLPSILFDVELKIYNYSPVRIFSLTNENCCLVIGEWKDNNCGGSHLSKDDKKKRSRNEIDDYPGLIKKSMTRNNNPKFYLCFEIKKNMKEEKKN